MTGSRQLRHYRFLREQGWTVDQAAAEVGFSAAEAQLTEADRMRGDLAGIQPLNPAAIPAAQPGETAMARKAKPNDEARGVTNLSATKDTIRACVTKIMRLKDQRKELNAAIGEERAKVKNCGVPPAALDLAIRMKEADVHDRQLHDEGYAIARDALGLSLQRSLFEMIEEPAGGEASEPDGGADGALAAARAHLQPVPDAVV